MNAQSNQNNGGVLGNALQQQATAIGGGGGGADGGVVKITRVVTDHWFNPRATATIYLSDGSSQTLADCTLMLVGSSTSDAIFKGYHCTCDAELTALAAAEFTASTRYCAALKYQDLFVLLGNLTIARKCVGQMLQKNVKKDVASKFGGNQAFLEFVYRRTSPLMMAVIGEHYMVTNHTTKTVSQSNPGFLRLVDKDGKVQPYAEDGEEPRSRVKTPSISATARKLLNVVSDMADNRRSSAPPRSAKKAKITKRRGGDDNDDDENDGGAEEEEEVEVLASGRGASLVGNVRTMPRELEASFERVAAMFRMGNLMTTTLKCHLSDAQIATFKARYETTPLLNDTFSFSVFSADGASPCLMDVKNAQVDFPHEWLATYEPLLDDKAFRESIERSLGAVVQNTLRNVDASVPEFLTTMTTRAQHQVVQWQQDSPLAQPNARHGVQVIHVAAGVDRQAVRCLVATRAAKRGTPLLSSKTALALTLPDLLALTIGHRLCGIDKAFSLPNNITANFVGQDGTTPFFLLFGSMAGAVDDEALMNFVGDTSTPDAANAQIVHYSPGGAVLQLLRDVDIGAPIVIDRGNLFRTIYATISGQPMLSISGGASDVQHVPFADQSRRASIDNLLASSVPSVASVQARHSEEIYRQRALDALDPRLFDAYVSSAPTTPKKRARESEQQQQQQFEYSTPYIINVFSPNCSPKIVSSKSTGAFATMLDTFSDEAGFNDGPVTL